MTTVPCPRCKGSGEQVEHNLTCVDGDTSYDHIDCKTCGGAGRVPAAWAVAFDETGLETRCDTCRKTRPCAIMENRADEIVIVCAKCAACGHWRRSFQADHGQCAFWGRGNQTWHSYEDERCRNWKPEKEAADA